MNLIETWPPQLSMYRSYLKLLFVAPCLAALLVAATSARADQGSLYDQKQHVESQIAALRDQIAAAKQQEGVLTSDIQTASSEIAALEGEIATASAKLSVLEQNLAIHRSKLESLRERLAEQSRLLAILRREYATAQQRLEKRLVELYETDSVSQLEILLQAESLSDLVDQVGYFAQIGKRDKEIVLDIRRAKTDMSRARARTAALEDEVAKATRVLAAETAARQAAQAELISRHDELSAARQTKQSLLASVNDDRAADEKALDASQADSAALAAQINAAQAQSTPSSAGSSSSGSSPPPTSAGTGQSSSGFIWPVSGPITSGFGPRWGRMHEGIDISAPNGTPVRAAGAGRIIVAGWSGGYGNLIVIDHGNGLATAYAHLSAIYVGGGAVAQGQTIGAVGSTGHSTGNHLHFEVRVNGAAANPLGYL